MRLSLNSSVAILTLCGLLLAACGPEATPTGSAQAGDLTAQAVQVAPVDSGDGSATATPTEPVTETIETISAETPAPTPDLAALTQTELDRIAVSNPRPLQLPAEAAQNPLGLVAWAPDGEHFLANAMGEEVLRVGQAGYAVADLFLGDSRTGKVSFLAHNAGWPAWSRDGRSVYYLTVRAEGLSVTYDLHRADTALARPELIAPNVGDTGSQGAVSELADGRLVLLDDEYQVAIWHQGELTPVADLVGSDALRGRAAGFSAAPDGHSLVVLAQAGPATLVDLAKPAVEAQLNGPVQFANNIAWSADSHRLAYGTSEGIYVYDRSAKSQTTIVDRKALELSTDDQMTSFQTPVWSPDEVSLLFMVTAKDWMRRGLRGVAMGYQFAALADGTQWKPISDKTLTVAPDKARAIESRWDPNTGQEMPTLVDLTWP